MEKIEDVHKENFKLIKQYGLKVGDDVRGFTITHIHPLYGWIQTGNPHSPARVKDFIVYNLILPK